MDLRIKGISFTKASALLIICLCVFLLGSVGLGGISIRIYMLMVLLLYGIFNRPKRIDNTIFKWYIIYLISLLLISIANEDILASYFWRNFLSYHFLSIATYIGFSAIIKNKEELHFLLFILVIILLFNSVVTILQYFNNPIAWAIGAFVGTDVEEVATYFDSHQMENFSNVALCSGINGNAVGNGYAIATFFPIVTCLIWHDNKILKSVGFIVLLINLIAAFCVQQRMAFLCVLLVSVLFLYNKLTYSRKRALVASIVIVVCVTIALFDFNYTTTDMGRLSSDTDNSARLLLFDHFVSYLETGDCLLGGYANYCLHYNEQHNTFLDVITRIGLIGFPVFLAYFCVTLRKLLRSFSIKLFSIESLSSLSCLIFILYSQTHSSGIQSGITYYWLIISILSISKRLQNYV